MRWLRRFAFLTLALPASALAGAAGFNIVNATGLDIQQLEIRRYGAKDWKPLSVKPTAGGRGPVDFNDPDCAFDIRAQLTGNVVAVWSAVNLCEAKSVTLNRNAAGALWVDYD